MKPKDLKFSFTSQEVEVVDNAWRIPRELPSAKGISMPVFSENKPVFVEYCSGNGLWISEKAKQHPEVQWIAVEKKYERVRKIWAKCQNLALDNLTVVFGMGEVWTALFVPDASVSHVFVNFPDPWPKKRHAKHRLIQDEFLNEVKRILIPGGMLTLVTDDIDYSSQMVEVVLKAGFKSSFPEPHYITDFENYGSSYFDSLWREKGREIRYHEFSK